MKNLVISPIQWKLEMFWNLSVVVEVTLNVFGLEEFGDVSKGCFQSWSLGMSGLLLVLIVDVHLVNYWVLNVLVI